MPRTIWRLSFLVSTLLALTACTIKEEPLTTLTDPQQLFEAIVAPGTEVQQVAAGFQFTEGPVWHPDDYLLFSDIPADTIYRWTPGASQATVYRRPCSGPGWPGPAPARC